MRRKQKITSKTETPQIPIPLDVRIIYLVSICIAITSQTINIFQTLNLIIIQNIPLKFILYCSRLFMYQSPTQANTVHVHIIYYGMLIMTYAVLSITSYYCSIAPLRKVIHFQAITRSITAQHPLLYVPWRIYYFSLQMTTFLLEKPMIFSASSAALFRLIRFSTDIVRIRILIEEELSIWLVAQNEKLVKVPLELSRYHALFIYLALYGKDEGVWQSDLLRKIYPVDEDGIPEENEQKENEQKMFNVHIHRIRQAFKQAAKNANLPYLDPFVTIKKDGKSAWRLSDACDIVVHGTLTHWHRIISQFESYPQKQEKIGREKLRAACAQIEAEAKGFLTKYLGAEGFGAWSEQASTLCREMLMHVLKFAANFEAQYARSLPEGAEAQTAYRLAAHYLERYACEASVLLNDVLDCRGEVILRRSFEMYKLAGESLAADIAFQSYRRYMVSMFDWWEPESATIEAWQKAIATEE